MKDKNEPPAAPHPRREEETVSKTKTCPTCGYPREVRACGNVFHQTPPAPAGETPIGDWPKIEGYQCRTCGSIDIRKHPSNPYVWGCPACNGASACVFLNFREVVAPPTGVGISNPSSIMLQTNAETVAPPAPAPHLHTPDDGPCDLCGDGKPVLRCSCPPSDTNPGCPVHCGAYRAGYLDAQKGAATAREWLRENGWVVAVHNDYKLDGELHTFWLFTKGDNCAKGEGRTDDEALAQCQLAASRTAALSAQVAGLERQLKEKK